MRKKIDLGNFDAVLKPGIEVKELWRQFINISGYPRCSGNEKLVTDYVISEATRHRLAYKTDNYGNILISVPSTGLSSEPVILQSHLDMVCESSGSFDFANKPIELVYENGRIFANNTTLGADNGIGVAAMLALMDERFAHPPILLLFTVDEENGLNGAGKLTKEFVTGKTLINLDGEEFGKIYTGCAGGIITTGTIKIDKIDISEIGYRITIEGLKGGHSGVDIDKGRINAIKLLFEILKSLEKFDIKIASIDAGDKINAIPRSASVSIFPLNQDIKRILNTKIDKIKQYSDEKIRLHIKEEKLTSCWSAEFSKRIINLINKLPNGVIERRSGTVYTSSNLASAKGNGSLTLKTFQRSYGSKNMNTLSSEIAELFAKNGFTTGREGEFPGWEPDESRLLKVATRQFEKLFKLKPEILAIHAGLECGIIKNRCGIKELISFGPTIRNAHSPNESVEIDTVEKFYRFLKKLIENPDK